MENDKRKYWFFDSKLNTALLLILIILMVIALCSMKKYPEVYSPSEIVDVRDSKSTNINLTLDSDLELRKQPFIIKSYKENSGEMTLLLDLVRDNPEYDIWRDNGVAKYINDDLRIYNFILSKKFKFYTCDDLLKAYDTVHGNGNPVATGTLSNLKEDIDERIKNNTITNYDFDINKNVINSISCVGVESSI